MTKEETVNKAIEIEFGLGNTRSIREHNSSLVKIAEHVYDLLQPSIPSNLDEAANKFAVFYDQGTCDGIAQECFKAGAELIISELFNKLKITPLKVIGKDESGYPVYDFEVGHYYRTFTLFGEKYKCDQTDSGKAGEQMLAELVKQYIEKGKRCMEQEGESQIYAFWDGFHNCAENILRELKEK